MQLRLASKLKCRNRIALREKEKLGAENGAEGVMTMVMRQATELGRWELGVRQHRYGQWQTRCINSNSEPKHLSLHVQLSCSFGHPGRFNAGSISGKSTADIDLWSNGPWLAESAGYAGFSANYKGYGTSLAMRREIHAADL